MILQGLQVPTQTWRDVCMILFQHLDGNDTDKELVETVYDLVCNERFDADYLTGDLAHEIDRIRRDDAALSRYLDKY